MISTSWHDPGNTCEETSSMNALAMVMSVERSVVGGGCDDSKHTMIFTLYLLEGNLAE